MAAQLTAEEYNALVDLFVFLCFVTFVLATAAFFAVLARILEEGRR